MLVACRTETSHLLNSSKKWLSEMTSSWTLTKDLLFQCSFWLYTVLIQFCNLGCPSVSPLWQVWTKFSIFNSIRRVYGLLFQVLPQMWLVYIPCPQFWGISIDMPWVQPFAFTTYKVLGLKLGTHADILLMWQSGCISSKCSSCVELLAYNATIKDSKGPVNGLIMCHQLIFQSFQRFLFSQVVSMVCHSSEPS